MSRSATSIHPIRRRNGDAESSRRRLPNRLRIGARVEARRGRVFSVSGPNAATLRSSNRSKRRRSMFSDSQAPYPDAERCAWLMSFIPEQGFEQRWWKPRGFSSPEIRDSMRPNNIEMNANEIYWRWRSRGKGAGRSNLRFWSTRVSRHARRTGPEEPDPLSQRSIWYRVPFCAADDARTDEATCAAG